MNSIQGPENFSPPSQLAPTALPTAPSVGAAPLVTATPNPLPQSIPATTQTSFFAFFIHHARTDPQARLCMYIQTYGSPQLILASRYYPFHFLDTDSSGYTLANSINDICRCHVLLYLASADY